MQSKEETLQPKKLGTFAGVFTPSILTILGIILFMRLGFVVGTGGLFKSLIILLIANSISLLTTFSLSAISTNMHVKGGGDYYLISRTLGQEYGGSIGLILFIAQSISIGFYSVGFGEVIAGLIGLQNHLYAQGIGVIAVLLLFILAWKGADWATRFQYVIMGVLILSLIAFFIGGFKTWDSTQMMSNMFTSESNIGFWALFAIFFPAVTGFTQGVSMSGDLENPSESLPKGTFAAVILSIIVYFVVAVIFAGSLPSETLRTNLNSMSVVSVSSTIIFAGVIAATLSSAMASFLGAPRILQSLASDKIFVFLNFFEKGEGEQNNPRRAILLSGVIALLTLAAGNLDVIASVVSMFFLISYGLLNYATYFEVRSLSPSFRPTFKWFDKRLSLAGAILCFAAMLAIDWKAGTVAIAVIFAIYQYLYRATGVPRWADGKRSALLQEVRKDIFTISEDPSHARDWRPYILVFSDNPERREKLIHVASWLDGGSGIITLVKIVIGKGRSVMKMKNDAEVELKKSIANSGVEAFPLVVHSESFNQGCSALLQSYGLGPIKANTVLLNLYNINQSAVNGSAEKLINYYASLKLVFSEGINVLLLQANDHGWSAIEDTKPKKRVIDIWVDFEEQSELALLYAHLMKRDEIWEDATLRVFAHSTSANIDEDYTELKELLAEVRIAAVPNIVHVKSGNDILAESKNSSFVLLPVKFGKNNALTVFGMEQTDFLTTMPVTLLTMVFEELDISAPPEEGAAGELASAEDKIKNIEKHLAEVKAKYKEGEDSITDAWDAFMKGLRANVDVASRNKLKDEYEEAVESHQLLFRKMAKLDAKLELAEEDYDAVKAKYKIVDSSEEPEED